MRDWRDERLIGCLVCFLINIYLGIKMTRLGLIVTGGRTDVYI